MRTGCYFLPSLLRQAQTAMSPIMSKRRAESSLEISRQLGPRARLLKPASRRTPDGRHGQRAGNGRGCHRPGQSASSRQVCTNAGQKLAGHLHHHQHRYRALTPAGPLRYRLVADCAVCCQPAPRAARPTPHAVPVATATKKDELIQMTAVQRRLPVNDAEDPAGPACRTGACSR
jgi:hypothetical protein